MGCLSEILVWHLIFVLSVKYILRGSQHNDVIKVMMNKISVDNVKNDEDYSESWVMISRKIRPPTSATS